MKKLGYCIIFVVAALAPRLHAGIISGVGVDILPAPPPSVEFNALQSNTLIFAFLERSGVTTGGPIAVNITGPGSYHGNLAPAPPAPVDNISANDLSSYLLHSDPSLGILDPPIQFVGSVTFAVDEIVVGIQINWSTLRASDAAFGSPTTAYPPPPLFSGIEPRDTIVLSGDRRTVSWDLFTGSGIDLGGVDQVRILTRILGTSTPAVPEPATILMASLGISLMLGARPSRARRGTPRSRR